MKKSAAESSKPASLPDDVHRAAIREDLDTTMLVEAAAGTGKTSCLVDRMVALVATGRATVDRLSAVTFTIKAAAQLRQRFQNGLEEALRTEREPGRRAHLAAALARLDSCFLGTIHAFPRARGGGDPRGGAGRRLERVSGGGPPRPPSARNPRRRGRPRARSDPEGPEAEQGPR